MMKLSKLTDYAVVILAAMVRQGDRLASASALAYMTALPEPTVSKILKLLARADIIRSVRGVRGGYAVNRDPENILISDVITAIEGPVSLTSCVKGSEETCAIEEVCQLNGRWNVVNRAIRAALDSVSLADMMPRHMLKKSGAGNEVRV